MMLRFLLILAEVWQITDLILVLYIQYFNGFGLEVKYLNVSKYLYTYLYFDKLSTVTNNLVSFGDAFNVSLI